MGLQEKLSLQVSSRGTQAMRFPGEIIGLPCFKGKWTLMLVSSLGVGLEAENLTP